MKTEKNCACAGFVISKPDDDIFPDPFNENELCSAMKLEVLSCTRSGLRLALKRLRSNMSKNTFSEVIVVLELVEPFRTIGEHFSASVADVKCGRTQLRQRFCQMLNEISKCEQHTTSGQMSRHLGGYSLHLTFESKKRKSYPNFIFLHGLHLVPKVQQAYANVSLKK